VFRWHSLYCKHGNASSLRDAHTSAPWEQRSKACPNHLETLFTRTGVATHRVLCASLANLRDLDKLGCAAAPFEE
jgi:hypothetical protein